MTNLEKSTDKFDDIIKYLSDDKNPMEIEAHRVAKKDTKKCLKEVFNIESFK